LNLQTCGYWGSEGTAVDGLDRGELASFLRLSMFWTPEREAQSAWVEHVPFAFWLVDVLRPRRIVELGAYNGVSYSAMCQAVKTLGLATSCFAIDTWKGDQHGGFYGEDLYRDFATFHDRRYSAFSQLLRSAFDDALRHFEDRSVDLLHIDGLHTYEAVKHDYESWRPKLAANAVVLFHDINVRERGFGVFRLWNEIAPGRPHFSFLHGYGLGALGHGQDYPEALRALFDANENSRAVSIIRETFGTLGRSVRIFSERSSIERELAGLKQTLTTRDRQIAEYADRDALLDRILASHSWRITRPLRFVQRLLHREWSLVLGGLRSSLSWILGTWNDLLLNFISRKGGSRFHPRFSFRTIVRLASLINVPNARKAAAYLRSGDFRLLYARVRDLVMQTKSAGISHTSDGDRGYLVSHPELTQRLRPQLDAFVSVVIPAYNAGSEFYWLIRKLRQQKGLRGIEIIVVDSGSTDDTVTIAETLGCKVICIPKAQFSHSFSRNRGAEEATGDLLLFMVQDAHPIGDYWLYGLASCLLQTCGESRLTALSCAEYSRYDSEVLYDGLIDTHYNFLGCRHSDRVGSFIGSTHVELRTQGQLSDVACLIRRDVFDAYKFEGRYAEDLTLGIRLIRDGHRIAMLSSIPVIHSHRRPAAYYLRRVFVDVIFLADGFPDFVYPRVDSIWGTLLAAFALHKALPKLSPSADVTPDKTLRSVIAKLQCWTPPSVTEHLTDQNDFGFPPFGDWVARVVRGAHDTNRASVHQCTSQFKAAFLTRLSNLGAYIASVYPALDSSLTDEINDAVEKTLAMTLGAQIAFLYLTAKSGAPIDANSELVMELRDLLVEGV
jgi:GT2 family glycosyltransferase